MADGSRLDLKIIAQPYTTEPTEFSSVMFPTATSAELADPTSRINTVDKLLGRPAWDSTLDEPVFATGAAAADAWALASDAFSGPPSATTAELVAIGNAINTTNKRAGKIVWNSTASILVVAVGATAGSVWNGVHDNLLDHTPA